MTTLTKEYFMGNRIGADVAPAMAVRLDLPHETYNAYDLEAYRLKRRVEDVMAEQLRRFQLFSVDDRPLTLGRAEREALEGLLGPLADGKALLHAVAKHAEVSVAGVKLALEPWQLQELKAYADKNGVPMKQALEERVKHVISLAFGGG